jgi:hypothetical protein
MTAVGTSSARFPREQPKLARGRLQQTCVVDARQHTIASGSCCCKTLGNSRSCLDVRTGSPVATAHAQVDRHDSKMARFALVRVF